MSTFPDGLFQYGGQPVGGGRYEGMWGNKVYFVDYDNGTAGSQGLKPTDAQKNLQTVIDAAGEWDVIYVRPRDPDTTGGDPQAIIPTSTSNFSTVYTQHHGLAIIGTGVGYGKSQAYQTRIQGSATVNTTPAFRANAPYQVFENLTFRRGGSTNSALQINGYRTDSGYSFGAVINNCVFWKAGATATSGALFLQSAWHTSVFNSFFEECAIGINLGSSESDITGVVIRNCDFNGLDTTVNCDIYSSGIVHNLLVENTRFLHDQPALGGTNKYFTLGAGCDGMFSQCYFGTEVATLSTAATYPAGVQVVHCFYEAATNLTA